MNKYYLLEKWKGNIIFWDYINVCIFNIFLRWFCFIDYWIYEKILFYYRNGYYIFDLEKLRINSDIFLDIKLIGFSIIRRYLFYWFNVFEFLFYKWLFVIFF